MLQPLNVLSVSDDPIVKGEFTLHLFGFSYRNINQLEHALPIAVETTEVDHHSITCLHLWYQTQRSS